MEKDLEQIQDFLKDILRNHKKALQIRVDTDKNFEAAGTIEAMQGKKKVDGMYFASVMPKPKDIRFYFFPLYTHRDQLIDTLSDELQKALKGKTCFHIKTLSEDMKKDLTQLVAAGVKIYQKDGLLA